MGTREVWRQMYGVEYDEKKRTYSYPNGHKFGENDICRITDRNEHGQDHENAGVLVRIRQQPNKYKMTYAVTVAEESEKWPKRILTSEIHFNEHEVNLELVRKGVPTPPRHEYEMAYMILHDGVPEYGLYTEIDEFVERITSYDLEYDAEGDQRRAEIKQVLKKMPQGVEQMIEGQRVMRIERIKKLGGRN